MSEIKVTRLGHRSHKTTGTITIASTTSHLDKSKHKVVVQYGVSFASPKFAYDKKFGINLASVRHEEQAGYNGLVVAHAKKHIIVMQSILCDIISMGEFPDWAFPLLQYELFNATLSVAESTNT